MSFAQIDRTDPGPRVAAHHRRGRGVTRIGYPIQVRTLTLARRAEITPGMCRLTLTGDELAGLHTYQCDDHVAIVFPDDDGSLRAPVADGDTLQWPRPLPPVRKYTIRRYDESARELDLDVVVHVGGLASSWATSAPLGSSVVIAGPPGAKAFAQTYDHYVFAGDATALPSIERWLREAGDDATGDIVVEVATAEETSYPLPVRPGVTVQWLVRAGNPGGGSEAHGESRLAATVAQLPERAGAGFLFAAGEAEDLRPLRAWAKGRMDALVTGYWKRGVGGFDDD